MIKNKLIAVFISSLMIILPIYSASVYAGLTNLEAKGIDDINGYIRQNDFIQFSVTASIDGDIDGISSDQVRLQDVKNFDSCVPSDLGIDDYDCMVRIPETGTRSFTTPSIPFTVELYDDSLNHLEEEDLDGEVVVDNKAPKISSFSITPELSNDGIVIFTYSVEDYAYTSSYTGECSGIEKIEFYDGVNGDSLGEETFETADCSIVSREYPYTHPTDGDVTICAKAYDRFMQESTSLVCDSFTVDRDAPVIDVNSFRVLYNNNEMYYFKATPINVFVSINITAADLDTSDVFADLSALNPDGAGYGNLRATCNQITTEIYECRWQISLKPDTGDSLSVVVKAKDLAGNEATQIISKTFTEDITGPVITSLVTDKFSGSDYFVSSRGNFIAQITEDVGVNPIDVLLHVGNNVYRATSCEPGWTCYWNDIQITQTDQVNVFIGTDSKDIFGNYVSEEFSIDVTIDKTFPRNAQIEISPVGGGTQVAFEGYLKIGDRLNIIATVEEENSLSAFVNLSSIISGADNVAAESCVQDDNNVYTCVWNTDPIDVQEYTTDSIKFSFIDVAGNSLIKPETIIVYGVEAEHEDFYGLTIDPTYILPIDKEVLLSLASNVYYQTIPFNLNYRNNCNGNDVEILATALSSECGGYVNIYPVSSGNSYTGFMQFNVDPRSIGPEWDKVEIPPCFLEFNVRCGNTFYSGKERKNITINVPLVSIQLPTESIANEIEDIKDSVTNFHKTMTKLSNLLTKFKAVCGLKAFFGALQTILDVIGEDLSICVDSEVGRVASLGACDLGVEATKGAKLALGLSFEGLNKLFDTTCNFVTCSGQTAGENLPFIGEKLPLSWKSGFCNYMQTEIKDRVGKVAGTFWAQDVQYFETDTLDLSKKSWVFAAGCGCIPGVIYNLQKMKQIECKKAVCLRDMVPAGLPVNECYSQYDYESCVYSTGQFTAILDFVMAPLRAVMNLISHPVAASWMGIRYGLLQKCASSVCTVGAGECTAKWTGSCIPYSIMIITESVLHMAAYVQNQEYDLQPETDFCGMLDQEIGQGENE